MYQAAGMLTVAPHTPADHSSAPHPLQILIPRTPLLAAVVVDTSAGLPLTAGA